MNIFIQVLQEITCDTLPTLCFEYTSISYDQSKDPHGVYSLRIAALGPTVSEISLIYVVKLKMSIIVKQVVENILLRFHSRT